MLGLICNDKPGAQTLDAAPILRRAAAHLDQYASDPLVAPSLAISIPEVASDAMLHHVYQLCAESGRIFQTHANEHLVAVERSLNACGRVRSNISRQSAHWVRRRCWRMPRW